MGGYQYFDRLHEKAVKIFSGTNGPHFDIEKVYIPKLL